MIEFSPQLLISFKDVSERFLFSEKSFSASQKTSLPQLCFVTNAYTLFVPSLH